MSDNINVTFTYNLPDDQYYQTSVLQKTASWEYAGPQKKYILVDTATNKITGAVIDEVHYEDFNERNTHVYAVEVDCSENPLMCSLFADAYEDPTAINRPTVSEEIPNSIPYVRYTPPDPNHTYELKEIEYNPSTNTFVTPLPWKQPFITWDILLSVKNNKLAASDRQMSEDLPSALYNEMLEYRQYLRNFTEIFGAAWTITLTSSGTGFVVGDMVSISDPVFKNGQVVDDIIITVTEVSDTGAIVNFTKSNTRALHIPTAATYSNVYYTTNGAGLGLAITLSKIKLVDPWKITPKDSPLG